MELIFNTSLSIEEIEKNFEDVDVFENLMVALQEALLMVDTQTDAVCGSTPAEAESTALHGGAAMITKNPLQLNTNSRREQ